MRYFSFGGADSKDPSGEWIYLPKFPVIPSTYEFVSEPADPNCKKETLFECKGSLFFLVADGVLYVKVSYGSRRRSLNVLYRFCPDDKTWESIFEPRFSTPHSNVIFTEDFQVVYLDQVFYFIHTEHGYVHGFSIKPNSAGFRPFIKNMPKPLYAEGYSTITTYMGRVLVYGPYEDGGKCYLQVYDPVKDAWTEAMRDILDAASYDYIPPIIMQHNGSCYRIAFNQHYDRVTRKPSEVKIVHELKTQIVDGVLSVELGEKLDQSHVLLNTLGAFQIDDDLFVCNRGGFVYKSGLKAWEGEWKGSDLECIEWIQNANSNIVMFTFDSRLADNDDVDDGK